MGRQINITSKRQLEQIERDKIMNPELYEDPYKETVIVKRKPRKPVCGRGESCNNWSDKHCDIFRHEPVKGESREEFDELVAKSSLKIKKPVCGRGASCNNKTQKHNSLYRHAPVHGETKEEFDELVNNVANLIKKKIEDKKEKEQSDLDEVKNAVASFCAEKENNIKNPVCRHGLVCMRATYKFSDWDYKKGVEFCTGKVCKYRHTQLINHGETFNVPDSKNDFKLKQEESEKKFKSNKFDKSN